MQMQQKSIRPGTIIKDKQFLIILISWRYSGINYELEFFAELEIPVELHSSIIP